MDSYKEEYVKALYARDENKFYYIQASEHFDFKFGSESYRDFCEFVLKKQSI